MSLRDSLGHVSEWRKPWFPLPGAPWGSMFLSRESWGTPWRDAQGISEACICTKRTCCVLSHRIRPLPNVGPWHVFHPVKWISCAGTNPGTGNLLHLPCLFTPLKDAVPLCIGVIVAPRLTTAKPFHHTHKAPTTNLSVRPHSKSSDLLSSLIVSDFPLSP